MRSVIRSRLSFIFIGVLLEIGAIGSVLLTEALCPTVSTSLSEGLTRSVSIGLYRDSGCSDNVSSIEWSLVDPGSQQSILVYIRNEGNSAAKLSLNATNWDPPEAETYIFLSWNYTGETLVPDQVIPVTLTLLVENVAPALDFTFTTVITALETQNSSPVVQGNLRLNIGLDDEGYVTVDMLLDSNVILDRKLGNYTLYLSVMKGVVATGALPGQDPFNSAPTATNVDGYIITQGYYAAGVREQLAEELLVAKLRLSLNGSAGAECGVDPVSLVLMDAEDGAEYDVTFLGEHLSFMRGDASGDGQVTIADAMMIAQYLSGNRPASDLNLLNAASVKHDGEKGDRMTIADAMFIAQYLVGSRDSEFGLNEKP